MLRSQFSKPITRHSSLDAASRRAAEDIGATSRALLKLIRAYKLLISPLFAGSCRFYPSCADYMSEAVCLHGTLKGAWLGIRRLGRCHPLGSHGFDPVPRS